MEFDRVLDLVDSLSVLSRCEAKKPADGRCKRGLWISILKDDAFEAVRKFASEFLCFTRLLRSLKSADDSRRKMNLPKKDFLAFFAFREEESTESERTFVIRELGLLDSLT